MLCNILNGEKDKKKRILRKKTISKERKANILLQSTLFHEKTFLLFRGETFPGVISGQEKRSFHAPPDCITHFE